MRVATSDIHRDFCADHLVENAVSEVDTGIDSERARMQKAHEKLAREIERLKDELAYANRRSASGRRQY